MHFFSVTFGFVHPLEFTRWAEIVATMKSMIARRDMSVGSSPARAEERFINPRKNGPRAAGHGEGEEGKQLFSEPHREFKEEEVAAE